MRTKNFKKLFAVALTGVFALQCAFVPVLAEDAAADEDTAAIEELAEDLSLEGLGDLGSVTFDVCAKGSLSMEGTTLFDIDADVTAITDLQAGAHSMTGTVKSSGITIEFAEYMDSDVIELQIPGIPAVLSYNFKEDPAGTYLASIVGEDALRVINNALQLMSCQQTNPEGMMKVGEEISAIITEAVGSLPFEQAPEKECTMGGETVVCQGVQVPLTAEFLEEVVDKILEVELPMGITYEEYFDQILTLQAQTDESIPTTVKDYVAYNLYTMPEFTLAFYMTDEGMPAEASLTAEGSTLALQLRGPAEMPWTEMAVCADDSEMGVLTIDLTETGVEAALSVMGQETCTFSFDTSDMSFEIASPMLPDAISGQIVVNEDGSSTLTASCDHLEVTANVTMGGTVVEPEGDVLDLTAMTQEEFASIAASLGSVFGNAAA